jgi:P27 family predicted phage terminase small subunit
MKGRKPYPTQLHVINGNPSRKRLDYSEPIPAPGIPEPPSFFDEIALAKWNELAPELGRIGVLAVVDQGVLAAFCIAWSELQHATETLNQEGRFTTRGTGGKCSHPAVAQQRTALKAVRDFAAVLGLDPSSRSRLRVQPADVDDPLATFLDGE